MNSGIGLSNKNDTGIWTIVKLWFDMVCYGLYFILLYFRIVRIIEICKTNL